MKKRVLAACVGIMVFGTISITGCGNQASLEKQSVTEKQTATENNPATEKNVAAENQPSLTLTVSEGNTANEAINNDEKAKEAEAKEALKAELRAQFLDKADAVIVNEDSVTFFDANSKDSAVTVKKNPGKVMNLYASFTTLWYEAGGTVAGCIGGESSETLYELYIGRNITLDEGVKTVATSSAGKKWDVETIIAEQPDLIIVSTAMSGYSTISPAAEAANIQVVAVDYNDFSDYLKWYKVFCNLTGHEEMWESVALDALEKTVEVIANAPTENNPTVFAMFSNASGITANTSNTVVGGMIDILNAKNIVDLWEGATEAERLDINLETVYAANPDIIIIQCHAGTDAAKAQLEETYGANPIWQALSAVKNNRVYFLEKELFHNKPNSRFAESYEILANIFYPGE